MLAVSVSELLFFHYDFPEQTVLVEYLSLSELSKYCMIERLCFGNPKWLLVGGYASWEMLAFNAACPLLFNTISIRQFTNSP